MPIRKFRLASIMQETPEVKTFRFEPADAKPFTFIAGQFVLLRIGNEARAYSISSHPAEKFIDLTIRIGAETYFPKKINQLKVSDIVEIVGPHGLFTLDPDTKSAVFIGAGVGIAGLRSLWLEAQKQNKKTKIIYSSRTEKEIIWRSDFDKQKVIITLTREQPADWKGEIGRIDAAMVKRNIKTIADNFYYICGPPEMVEAVELALLELGVPSLHIKAEKWGGISKSV